MRRIKPVALLPLAAAVVPYLATLGGGFVYDDHILVEQPAAPAQDRAGLLAPWWGAVAAASYWRPLATLSFAFDRWLLGPQAVGHHAVNLLLHALLVLVAWDLARRLTARAETALATACLFAVHPLHVEPVAWISARPDLLAALLAFAAWAVALRGAAAAAGSSGLAPTVGAAVLFALALAAKESAIALPLLVGAAALFRPPDRRQVRRWLVAATVVVAAWLALRSAAVEGWTGALPLNPLENPAVGLPAADRGATVARAGVMAARLLVLPVPLRSDYSVPVLSATPIGSTTGIVSVTLLLGTVVLVIVAARASRRRRGAVAASGTSMADGPVMALGVGLALAGWLPVSSLLVPIGSLLAERYLLISSFGVALAVAGLFGMATRSLARSLPARLGPRAERSTFAVLAIVAMLTGAGLAARRAPVWGSDEALFAEEDSRQPASFRVRFLRGLQLYAAGDDEGALARLTAATEVAPGFAPAQEALGRTRLRLGQAEAAAAAARAALAAAGTRGEPALRGRCHVLLGEALSAQGQRAAAEREFATASTVDPDGAAGPRLLGELLYADDRVGDAVVAWTEAARRDPTDPVPHHNLAVAWLRLGRPAEARAAVEQALRLPNPPAASAVLLERLNAAPPAPPRPDANRSPPDGAAPPSLP